MIPATTVGSDGVDYGAAMRAAARRFSRAQGSGLAPVVPAARGVQQLAAASVTSAVRTTNDVRRCFSEGAPPPASAARLSETFISAEASGYLEELYLDWMEDPASVHPSWHAYFKALSAGAPPGAAVQKPGDDPVPEGGSDGAEMLSVQQLVRAYQATGHSDADLDPLGIRQVRNSPAAFSAPRVPGAPRPRSRLPLFLCLFAHGSTFELTPPACLVRSQADITLKDASGSMLEGLDTAHYGWTDADLSKSFNLGSSVSSGYLGEGEVTLGELVQKLQATYASKIGFEFMHLQSRNVVNWFRDRVERYPMYDMNAEQKKLILERLMDATLFEQFLEQKYANDKRFGLEGCESLIAGMKALIDSSVEHGVEDVVIGMPHRGRLNVLTQVMEKPMEAIFSEFAGANATDEGSGDVKYHLGTSVNRKTRSGKTVHLSLAANPSHLEAVNPVIAGKARAVARDHAKDATGSNFASQDDVEEHGLKRVMPICLHGDAAFAGQGVVYETMGMCELPCYSNGGTVHIIVNNQIGFTTDPRFSRSTPYCCDLGKTYNAPIFHGNSPRPPHRNFIPRDVPDSSIVITVNGDDPEAVVFVCNLAAEWRATFQKDVIIDIVCYRRNGHNEQDQPSFTSPLMYEAIGKHPTGLDVSQPIPPQCDSSAAPKTKIGLCFRSTPIVSLPRVSSPPRTSRRRRIASTARSRTHLLPPPSTRTLPCGWSHAGRSSRTLTKSTPRRAATRQPCRRSGSRRPRCRKGSTSTSRCSAS